MSLNFQQRNPASTSRVLLIALLVVAVLMMAVYAREGENGPLHNIQASVSGVFSPVGAAGAAISAGTDTLTGAFGDATADEGTLSGLKEYNEELISEHSQLEEYKQENERLQQLLDLKDKYSLNGTAARVIGRSGQAWSQTVTLDKGSNSGVDTGQTVMGSSGVVGQVVSVTPNSSTVRLLSDPSSGAAAKVQSSRAEGIVKGSLSGVLYLEDLDASAKVEAGDVVITSGLGGSYAGGLIIGTVVSVENTQGDSSRRAVVAPNDEISAMEEVFVVATVGADDDDDDESSDTLSNTSSAYSDAGSNSQAGDGEDSTQNSDSASDSQDGSTTSANNEGGD